MLEFFSDHEYIVDKVWFYHKSVLYTGSGYMTWSHQNGFHILASIRSDRSYSDRKYIRDISFNYPNLKMILNDGRRAFAPRVEIDDWITISNHLSIDFDCLIFIREIEKQSSSWLGSALIETKTKIFLPDRVTNETKIGQWHPSTTISHSGLFFENGRDMRIVGRIRDDKYLYIDWNLPSPEWDKGCSWRFADAFKDSISIVSGAVSQLRYYELKGRNKVYTKMNAGLKTMNLDRIFRFFDHNILDKNTLIDIAVFLSRETKEGDLCRKMFRQVVDASTQNSHQSKELLVSTVLEALLRSYYNNPFDESKNKRSDSFSLENRLKEFSGSKLSDDPNFKKTWRKVTNRVIDAHRRLRDRNAHPDWLSKTEGSHSPSKIKDSINDITLLTRFYGHIILALAGFKKIEPKFPEHINNWLQLSDTTPENS